MKIVATRGFCLFYSFYGKYRSGKRINRTFCDSVQLQSFNFGWGLSIAALEKRRISAETQFTKSCIVSSAERNLKIWLHPSVQLLYFHRNRNSNVFPAIDAILSLHNRRDQKFLINEMSQNSSPTHSNCTKWLRMCVTFVKKSLIYLRFF